MSDRGLFFSIEGFCEGVGKTTLTKGLQKLFIGKQFYFTREIGGIGSPVAEAIRQVALRPDLPPMDPITEELLVRATRMAHMHDVVIPKLIDGINVISDRCMLSSMAYQGVRGGIGVAKIYQDHVTSFQRLLRNLGLDGTPLLQNAAPLPDYTYILYLSVEEARERMHQGRAQKDMNRIDLESADSHQLIHRGYEEAIKYLQNTVGIDHDRLIFIDARKPKKEVLHEVYTDILTILEFRE